MCCSVTFSNTNPTWMGPGVKLGLVIKNVLCYIITYVNIEFFSSILYKFVMDVL